MARRNFFLVPLMIGLILFAGACSDKNAEKIGQSGTNGGLINVIKNGKLINFQSTTIGNAFDSYKYLTKKEWKVEQLKSGHFTVDFIGWFESDTLNDNDIKAGVTSKGIDVKFVINPDGSYYMFMVTKIESKSDGKVYGHELTDSAGILSNIYANKKIIL